MWGFPVTINAITIFNVWMKSRPHGLQFIIGNEVSVAPLTILLNRVLACLLNKNDLRLVAKGKYGRMPRAILGFKIIVVQKIVVGHMAVVAIGPGMMRAVAPGGILRPHYVAVDTGLRPIGQIGWGIGNVKYKSA